MTTNDLNAHLTDETLGLQLLARSISEHEGTRLGTFLLLLSWELEEDRDSLLRLMGALGVRRRRVGAIFARIAHKAGALRHDGRSPLAELDALHVLIEAKLDLWTALRASLGDGVEGVDFDELIRRAERQSEAVERRRLHVAARLADRGGPAERRSGHVARDVGVPGGLDLAPRLIGHPAAPVR